MKLGYKCGPAGVQVPCSGEYIVRPIYNLMGMSLGAKIMHLRPDFVHCQIPPGHFWCERFKGSQHTVDFEWSHLRDGLWGWTQIDCWKGYNNPQLWRFNRWEKVTDVTFKTPWFFSKLGWNWNMRYINVETIGDKIIEVHLRRSPDPQEGHEILIPIWQGDDISSYMRDGYKYIEAYDDADGQLPIPRLGFCVK